MKLTKLAAPMTFSYSLVSDLNKQHVERCAANQSRWG